MLISHLFDRHKKPAPRFAPGLFIGLIVVFTLIGQTKPLIGLTGLGTTLLVTGVLIELNRIRIWENYKAMYKRGRKAKSIWTKPNPVYYTINVVFLWPFMIFLGIMCLWAAYLLT